MLDEAGLDPPLARIRAELEAMYGDRLVQVVLFGSRARGDARADSDYDVAVFLRGVTGLWAECQSIGELQRRLIDELGIVVNCVPLKENAIHDRTIFMHDVRRDGIRL